MIVRLPAAVHRAALVHELAEHGAEQEQREELTDEVRGARHERLRPVSEHGLPRERRHDERSQRSEKENAPAAISERDQNRDSQKHPQHAHRCFPSVAHETLGRRFGGQGTAVCTTVGLLNAISG